MSKFFRATIDVILEADSEADASDAIGNTMTDLFGKGEIVEWGHTLRADATYAYPVEVRIPDDTDWSDIELSSLPTVEATFIVVSVCSTDPLSVADAWGDAAVPGQSLEFMVTTEPDGSGSGPVFLTLADALAAAPDARVVTI